MERNRLIYAEALTALRTIPAATARRWQFHDLIIWDRAVGGGTGYSDWSALQPCIAT